MTFTGALFFATVIPLTLVFVISMEEGDTFRGVLTVIGILLFFWTVVFGSQESYRDGQVDALKGNVKYEMKVEPDTSYVKK